MLKEKVQIKEVLSEKEFKEQQDKYKDYVEQVTPKNNCTIDVLRAFWVGGSICLLGQALQSVMIKYGIKQEDAVLYTILVLVLLSVMLTGLGLYQKMAKYAGAGTLVPITGFANSVAAAAIDFKAQGQVFGIGCFIFSIAGPVILYGIFSSFLVGGIYWLITLGA